MKAPFFTIIIPTLNEEDYIGRLLKNLTQQKETHFEVFVVDGSSTDKTVAIVDQFKDKLQLKVLVSDKKNVSNQRNLGASRARGKYLVFFDADVQVPIRFLSQLRSQIEEKRPAYLTTYLRADSNIVGDKMIATFINLGIEAALFVEKPFIPGFNFIIRRDVFEKAKGFSEKVLHGEDYELANRIHDMGHTLTILRVPRLVFSLRRYRTEGRLVVIRKNVVGTLHVYMKGHITKPIFDYPMGGGWYKFAKKPGKNGLEKMEAYVKKLVRLLLE